GFFKVEDETAVPPKLGAEIGASTATNIRRRFFCLIDRTQLVLNNSTTGKPELTNAVNAVTPGQPNLPVPVTVGALNGTISYSNGTSIPWSIMPNSILVVDRGNPTEETVVVTAVNQLNSSFQAVFLRPHAQGFGITIPGNPGPQPQFDPTSLTYTPL